MKIKVLAIGLTPEQLHGIKYAAKKGLYVIGIDRIIPEEVKPYLDECYELDLKNVEGILAVVENKNIDFVIPSTIGNLLTTIGMINDKLNLPGVSFKLANMLTNKNLFSEELKRKKLFAPKRYILNNLNEINLAVEEVGYPCIFKPSRGSGSRGVVVVNNKLDVSTSLKYTSDSLLENEVIVVEQFIQGEEYGVDFQIINGNISILTIRKKIMTDLPFRQEVGYISMKSRVLEELIIYDLSVFFANEVDNIISLGHIDIIEYGNKLFFVEMSLRPAGLGIMYNFLPFVIGYNPVESLIDELLGVKKVQKKIIRNMHYGLFFWDLPIGEITSFEKKALRGTLLHSVNFKEHDVITTVKKGTDIFPRGFFILKNKSESELLQKRAEILSTIKLKSIEI